MSKEQKPAEAPAAAGTPVAEQPAGRIFDVDILRRLYSFVKPYQTRFYLLIGIILLSACLAPVMPLLIRYTLDNIIAAGNYERLTQMLFIMIGVLVLQACIQFLNTYLSGWMGQFVIRDNPGAVVPENPLPPAQIFR